MVRMQRDVFPSNWMLMIHILRLYKDINHFLQMLETGSIQDVKPLLDNIIGRLKILNTLGGKIPWFFLTFLPLDILIASNERLDDRRFLRKYLLALRNSIEKIIVGRIGSKLLRRKGIHTNLRRLTTIFYVPQGFREIIPGYTYIPGRRPILLTASHAASPGSDINTGFLARRLAIRTRSYALISHVPRLFIDSNRLVGRLLPFRRKLDEILSSRRIRLILDLHSMERDGVWVEIGVWFGLSATKKFVMRLIDILDRHDIPYEISYRFFGGDIIFYHANRPRINAIQLEISNAVRRKYLRRINNALTEYINIVGDIHRRNI